MSIDLLARWLVIDKPAGFTSHDVVARARRALNMKRIGHTGTLDPDATGVLVLAIGKATRLIQYLPGGKTYRAQIQLGLETDSYDTSGLVLNQKTVPEFSLSEIEAALERFLGPQMQVPPMVSAISIGGKRLYELARQGIEIERPARAVEFFEIKVIGWRHPFIECELSCSAGTYIRSLAHDVGQLLGCGASLSYLQRTRAHTFALDQGYQLDSLKPIRDHATQGLEVDWPLQHLPKMSLANQQSVSDLRQGRPLLVDKAHFPESQSIRIYTPEGDFAAIGEVFSDRIQPRLLMIEPIYEKSVH